MIRVAVLFDNFGPYHIARLSALAQHCCLLGIEVSSVSAEYKWQPTDFVPFDRITLFRINQSKKIILKELENKLEEAVSSHQTDVLAVPGWSGYHAFIALRVALRHSIPVVVMSESQEIDFTRSWFKEWFKRRCVALCQAALAGGEPHQAYLEKLGMHSSRIFKGYDIVDNGYFSSRADNARVDHMNMRIKYVLPSKYFLASARFIEKKNLHRLIISYSIYRQAKSFKMGNSDVCFDLVLLGDGELRTQLESLVAELGLSDVVHMPGFKQYPELPIYYGLADVFIHASSTEQWGLVVNEAMAAGLPVLVSDRCGCAKDLVTDGVNGYTFDPFDVDRLANLMLKMHDSDLICMANDSREIISRWGPKAFSDGLLNAANIAMQSELPEFGFKEKLFINSLIRLNSL